MKAKLRLENIIVSTVLLITVLVFFFKSSAFSYVDEGITAVKNEVITAWKESHPKQNEEQTVVATTVDSYSQVSTNFSNGMYSKIQLCELNGELARQMGFIDFYKNTGGIKLSNGYVAGLYGSTSTDYEIQQLVQLKAFCDTQGVQLLYVNEPTKYIDDAVIENELGVKSYVNQNADLLLSRMSEAGIEYVDLRDNIRAEGLDSFSLFYRTDHHWTTVSAKWAAKIISEKLNADYGYNIDTSLYDDSNFTFTEYKNAWLGEQGKKLSEAYVELDDFACIEPKFDTNYTVVTADGAVLNGSFADTMIDKNNYKYDNIETIYACPSWHYSYMRRGVNNSVIINNQVSEGKILVLGDSYEQVTAPFLSLGVNEVRTLVLRSYDGSLQEYIRQNDIDTVIVAYASFMIGAHDNPGNANYDMFNFE